MRYLLFGSFLFCLLTSCAPSKKMVSGVKKEDTPFWTSEWRDPNKKNEYRILIETPNANITGIFIVKQMDGKWKGTIINEFGIKVLDFESCNNKCDVMNVIPFLNKWYIRKVIASDMLFIMEIDNPNYKIGAKTKKFMYHNAFGTSEIKGKQLLRFFDGKVKYFNRKHKLTYSLQKI